MLVARVLTNSPALGVPPLAYFVLNIDPVLIRIGPLAIHWYGLMYVVAITIGFSALMRYTRRLGIHEDQLWRLFIWTAIAGLIGGRLYFVIQQPDLVSHYLLQPQNIFAVWNGGMAFFGAIFLGSATLFLLARRYGLSPFIALDGGAFFAAVGQIFGRFGNIINGDILGLPASNGPVSLPGDVCAQAPCLRYVPDAHLLPWSVVYLNPHSFAPTGVAFQPAPVYEMLMNILVLALLLPIRFRLPRLRAGLFFTLYVGLYGLTQFIVFFFRGTEPATPFLGVDGLKQAQWTGLFVILATIPLYLLVRRFSSAWTFSAAHPVPWTPATDEREGVSVAVKPRVTVANPAQGASAARVAPSDNALVVELPVWQPASRAGGRLRNVFGARDDASEGAGE